MPSIDTVRNKGSSLGQVSCAISGEVDGQLSTPSAPLKTTGSVNGESSVKLNTEDSPNTMAPYKNGTTEQGCKQTTNLSGQPGEKKDVDASGSSETHEKRTISSENPDSKCQINGDSVRNKIAGEEASPQKDGEVDALKDGKHADDNDDVAKGGDGQKDDEHKDKTADEKRKEYKEKPRSTSLEYLGLQKKKNPILNNQDHLSEELLEAFHIIEMKRRKSAPSRLPGGKVKAAGKIDEEAEDAQKEGTEMDDLARDFDKKVGLEEGGESSTKPGFAQRMEKEQPTTNLTAKGPIHQRQVYAPRTTPYSQLAHPVPHPTGQGHPGFGNTYQTSPQQMLQPDLMGPQMIVRSSTTKVAVPGMKQHGKIVTGPPPDPFYSGGNAGGTQPFFAGGYTGQLQDGNQHQMQYGTVQTGPSRLVCVRDTMQGRREPEESIYNFPSSPTGASSCGDPNSPASAASPDHMQTIPSPASTPSMINSPKSVMSSEVHSNMSTSPAPSSPYSVVSPPPSVDSGVSGSDYNCESPSQDPYTITAGTNSGTVFINDNCTPLPDNRTTLDVSGQYLRKGLTTDDNDKNRRVHEIAKSLAQYIDEVSRRGHHSQNVNQSLDPCNGMMYRQVILEQERVRQAPIQVPMPQTQLQTQPRSLEAMVNSMPLDLLCSQDEDEDTALHIAISQGNESLSKAIIHRLVQSGRKDALNIRDKLGQTPVYVAAVMNQPMLILELLKNGADIMIPNKENTTPLHYVATKGYANALKGICYGILQGQPTNINFNIENTNGMSPLQCAVQAHGRFEQVYDGNRGMYDNKLVDSTDTLQVLLYIMYADTSFQDSRSGKTALHYAVELKPNPRVNHNTYIMRQILESCADAQELVSKTTYGGNTPLHLIAGLDYTEDYIVSVVDLLLSYGADINAQNAEKIKPHDLVDKEKRKKVYSRLQGDHMQGKC